MHEVSFSKLVVPPRNNSACFLHRADNGFFLLGNGTVHDQDQPEVAFFDQLPKISSWLPWIISSSRWPTKASDRDGSRKGILLLGALTRQESWRETWGFLGHSSADWSQCWADPSYTSKKVGLIFFKSEAARCLLPASTFLNVRPFASFWGMRQLPEDVQLHCFYQF